MFVISVVITERIIKEYIIKKLVAKDEIIFKILNESKIEEYRKRGKKTNKQKNPDGINGKQRQRW